MSKKRKSKIAVFIVIIVLVLIFVRFLLNKPMIVQMGEVLRLDSEKDMKDKKFFLTPAYFYHEGVMEFTVINAELYNTFEEVGYVFEHINKPVPKDRALLLLDCVMKNEDAKPAYGARFFNICLLNMSDKSDFGMGSGTRLEYTGEVIYFSESNWEEGERYALYYDLPPGETMKFQVGYWVNEEAYNEGQLVLKIGNTSDCQYGVEIK